jgi:hypothetical protein
MNVLYELIKRLRDNCIFFEIKSYRESFVMLSVSVPGERWEIEISGDGGVEVEVFKSDGELHDETKLAELFQRYSD